MELQKCIDSNLYGREKKTLILMEQSFHKKQGNSKLLQGILKLMKDKGIFFHVFKDDEIPFDLVRKQIYGRIINPRL